MAEIFIQQRLCFIVFKKYSSYIFNELFPLQVGRMQEDTKRQVKGKINQMLQKQAKQGEMLTSMSLVFLNDYF